MAAGKAQPGRQRKRARKKVSRGKEGSHSGHGLIDGAVVKALNHPLRVEILDLLCREGSRSPVEMSKLLDQGLSSISYHVKVLFEKCGLLELTDEVPKRGAVEHFYRAKPAAFIGRAARAATAFDRDHADERDVVSWLPVSVDEKGRTEVVAILSEAFRALGRIEKESRARVDESGEEPTELIAGVAAFQAESKGLSGPTEEG